MTTREPYLSKLSSHGDLSDFVNDGLGVTSEPARPDAEDRVSRSLEAQGVAGISGCISVNAIPPVLSPSSWQVKVHRTSVPEATIDKDRHTGTNKDQIWRSSRDTRLYSVTKSVGPKQSSELNLGRGISAPDGSHVPRPGGSDRRVAVIRGGVRDPFAGRVGHTGISQELACQGVARRPIVTRPGSRPLVVDLFAGAGLFSAAFAAEGFSVVQAVELDAVAAQTYARQLGDHVTVADVRAVEPRRSVDVLVAGPPCQGFSTLGKRDPDDPRNRLSLEVVRWAAVSRPAVVVVENVAAFLDAPVWQELVDGLNQLGYTVSAAVLDAAKFGVAQRRLRSFTVASLVGTPRFPIPANISETVRTAWEGLPPQPDGENLHYAPHPTPLALERMRLVPPGGNKLDIMARAPHLVPPSWWRIGTQAGDVWGRMVWDSPSNTLRTCLQDPTKARCIHPEQHRVMSLREAARLHSVPDDWTFVGPPLRVARQIGNSVPPRLGRAVAREVASLIGF
jgi:DNA (cytosine-5)-methyltransferase 1